jgi:glutaredoxin
MNITIYTTDTCAYCPLVKKFLDSKGLPYKVINCTNDSEARKTAQRLSGALTVPITTIGPDNPKHGDELRVIVGWQPSKLAEAIKE